MDKDSQAAFGYGLVGLLIGLFILPFVYLYLVRTGMAEARDYTWLMLFMGIALGPAVLLGIVGKLRGSPSKA